MNALTCRQTRVSSHCEMPQLNVDTYSNPTKIEHVYIYDYLGGIIFALGAVTNINVDQIYFQAMQHSEGK